MYSNTTKWRKRSRYLGESQILASICPVSKFSLLTVPSDLPSIWLRRGLNGHQSPADFKGRRSRVNPIYVCSRSRPHNTKSRLCLPGIRWRNNWWHRTKCTLTHSAGLIYCMLFFCTTKRALHFLIMKVLFLRIGARHSGHQVFQQQLSQDQIGFEVVSRSDAASRAGNGEKAHLKLICNAHFLLIFWHRRNHFLQQACKHQTIKSFFKTFPLCLALL